MRVDGTTRFLRPHDVSSLRRNQTRIHVQQLLIAGRSVLFVLSIVTAVALIYRHTQSDSRFSVKSIEITGSAHTSRAAIEAITRRYSGINLFRIDIAGLQRDLGALPWVGRVDIEKKLPGSLRIVISERVPVALLRAGGGLRYLDDKGKAFAELDSAAGDDDLPIVIGAAGSDLARMMGVLRNLRAHEPALFSRVSEIRAVPPDGIAIYDRSLAAYVYAVPADLPAKWRTLCSIAAAEKLDRGSIEYADLRFADRVVLKPLRVPASLVAAPQLIPSGGITN